MRASRRPPLAPGQAVQVMTGAPVPRAPPRCSRWRRRGASTAAGASRSWRPWRRAQNIARQGSEGRAGDVVLVRGETSTPPSSPCWLPWGRPACAWAGARAVAARHGRRARRRWARPRPRPHPQQQRAGAPGAGALGGRRGAILGVVPTRSGRSPRRVREGFASTCSSSPAACPRAPSTWSRTSLPASTWGSSSTRWPSSRGRPSSSAAAATGWCSACRATRSRPR